MHDRVHKPNALSVWTLAAHSLIKSHACIFKKTRAHLYAYLHAHRHTHIHTVNRIAHPCNKHIHAHINWHSRELAINAVSHTTDCNFIWATDYENCNNVCKVVSFSRKLPSSRTRQTSTWRRRTCKWLRYCFDDWITWSVILRYKPRRSVSGAFYSIQITRTVSVGEKKPN